MHIFKWILIFTLGALLVSPHASAVDRKDVEKTLKEFKFNPTAKEFFGKSYGWAVFPTIGKGGFGIGAAHGSGEVYKQGTVIGETSMTQVSIGFQAGGQAYSQIIFFENKAALDKFTAGNFEFSATANVIVITASAEASTGTTGSGTRSGVDSRQTKANAVFSNGMAVLTLVKGGAMYEASLAGQKYSYKPYKSK